MKIKILIAYHKRSKLLKDDILTPIHVGRANANKNGPDYPWLIENMIGDDTGDNISKKNPSYNELTALYWAWKNYDKLGDPDFIGLMHYRRHFIFDPKNTSIVTNVESIDSNYYDLIKYNRENLDKLLTKYDFIYNRGRVKSIYEQYFDHHRIEDLELAVKLVKSKYPSYSSTASKYMSKSYGCFANMFIMPKKMFFEYCSWLFNILEEFEQRVDLTNRRLFISERLTGIFVDHALKRHKRGLPLSSTFICEKLTAHVCSIFDRNQIYQTAVTMSSMQKSIRYPDIDIHYHLIYRDKNVDFDCLKPLEKSYFHIDWIYVDKNLCSDELLPGYVADIFPPNIGKILFLDNRTIINGSLDIILEACNTFEFMVVHSSAEKGNIYCFNTKFLRLNNVSAQLAQWDSSLVDFFKQKYPHETKPMAEWVVLNVLKERDSLGLYKDYTRAEFEDKNKVYEKCMVHYDLGLEPWNNYRCAFNIYWWEKTSRVPASIEKMKLDADKISGDYYVQNVEFLKNYEATCEQNKTVEQIRRKFFVRAYNKSRSMLKRGVRKIKRKIKGE